MQLALRCTDFHSQLIYALFDPEHAVPEAYKAFGEFFLNLRPHLELFFNYFFLILAKENPIASQVFL